MYLSRIVIRGFRNFVHLDIPLTEKVTCVVGENNTGKSNFVFALRLALDAGLSSTSRNLVAEDFSSGIDFSVPTQVVVSVEFRNFADKAAEEGMLMNCVVGPDVARITYRFRPRKEILEAIKAKTHPGTGMTIEDYRYEMRGGGKVDPAKLQWTDDLGKWVSFEDLQQNYLMVLMEPLRDVEQRLKQSRFSPLAKLLTPADIPATEQAALVSCLEKANAEISGSKTISSVGTSIKDSMDSTAGKAFTMDVSLGMSSPSFTDISRSLTVLLSNAAMKNFEPGRNGLGLNNILYISMLAAFFDRRVKEAKTSGQLLVIEEPEAHLHPQLQRVLFKSLQSDNAQTLITTHSTHITSQAPLRAMVVLTNDGTVATKSTLATSNPDLTSKEMADLERYLDATRSTLLFARKVVLVEGPAELFLIPQLVKTVMKVNLDEEGISVIPIHGAHFDPYTKLFGPNAITKRCSIITDGDAQNEVVEEALDPEDEADVPKEGVTEDTPAESKEPAAAKPTRVDQLKAKANDQLKIFIGETTLEMELTDIGTLGMFAAACAEVGAPRVSAFLKKLETNIGAATTLTEDQAKKMAKAKKYVLNTSKRFQKGRFAQIVSKHAGLAKSIPAYIRQAIEWVAS